MRRIWVMPACLMLFCTVVWGQQPQAAPQLVAPPFELPGFFKQPVPSSLDDLKAFELHVQKILPTLRAATVNLRIGNAQGSGVIVNAEGLILTAAHVTGAAGQRVNIIPDDSLNTGQPAPPPGGRGGFRRLRGTTLGRDSTQDASMVRIESDRKDWPFCPLAKVDAEPGDWCIVLGHPGGYDENRGLVVRVGRVIRRDRLGIQTDCELLGGDSGGPLFNMQGEVIGINSRIGQETDFNLHVPADAYRKGWDRFVNSEEFRSSTYAYLGVNGIPNPNGKGLLIQEVYEGTGARRADIRIGDILTTFQGKEINSLEQLKALVEQEPLATRVDIKLLRNGEEVSVRPRLGISQQ